MFRAGTKLSRILHYVACFSLLLIALVTASDILMRSMRRPIVGSFEIVTFLGAIVVGFSLPYTSLMKGHVYVDIVIDRLKGRARKALLASTRVLAIVLFALVGVNFVRYGISNIYSGEVSPSFRIPLYPLSFALAFAFFLEAFVLFYDFYRVLRDEG